MIINTNATAISANSALNRANNSLASSTEKLSSGFRINTAADDAAGLAISEKMRAQINGLDMASRNAQDGISMIQTAEGALSETESILQRMRELAVQSGNDTNTDTDRAELQKEVDQLAQEITRIANDTEFNTKSLLNGGLTTGNVGEVSLQIGANEGQSMSFSINAMDAQSLGVAADSNETTAVVSGSKVSNVEFASTVGSSIVDSANITFNSADNTGAAATAAIGTDFTVTGSAAGVMGNGYAISFADNATEGIAVNHDAKTITVTADFSNTPTAVGSIAVTESGTDPGIDFTFGGSYGGITAGTTTGTTSGGADANSDETLITVSDGSVSQVVTVADTDTSVSIATGAFEGLSFDTSDIDGLASGSDSIAVSVESVTATAATFSSGALSAEAATAAGIDISSDAAAANTAITAIDTAIETVSAERSRLGAYQNRLDHTINNLNTSSENLTSAKSRITDVDMAAEMMAYTTQSTLVQAATAMLAQANQQPQTVLQLLG